MRITGNIILNFSYILFYININYQLLNESIPLSALYLSFETNPIWKILIKKIYFLNLII